MSNPLSFQPLLFGGDFNVYSVARAFHEAYGLRSVAFGKYPSFPCHNSAIIDYRVCPDNEDERAFRRNIQAVSAEFSQKTSWPPTAGTLCRKMSSPPTSAGSCWTP